MGALVPRRRRLLHQNSFRDVLGQTFSHETYRNPFLAVVRASYTTACTTRREMKQQMVEEINADQLDKVISENKVVFVDCHAVWCHPCRILSPILEGLEEKYSNKGFKVVKIDVDENREFSAQNQITGVPSVIVYSEGHRVIFDDGSGRKLDKLVGVMPEEVYTQIIENLLAEEAA